MSRPHVTRVSQVVAGRLRQANNRGIRSGRERSSPTWGHGCRGVSGWRKPVDLVFEYECPSLALPPQISKYTSPTQAGPSIIGISVCECEENSFSFSLKNDNAWVVTAFISVDFTISPQST